MTENYPSKRDLADVKRLADTSGKVAELVGFIKLLWKYSKQGVFYHPRFKKFNFELHTIGWSGNEEIISALKGTMFWILYWRRSDCGGHYYFNIPTLPKKGSHER